MKLKVAHVLASPYLLVHRGTHFFYTHFVEPRSSTEDDRRKEFILNVILSGTNILLGIYYLFVIKHALREGIDYRGVPVLLFTLIYASFLLLHVLSRKNHFYSVSHILVWVFILFTTYGAYQFGADLPIVLLTYVLIIAIASILISTFYSFIITGVISFILFIIWIGQVNGHFVPDWHWKTNPQPSFVVENIVMFGLIVTVFWLSNREIEKSLARARKSEAELKQERDSLELRVDERTRELKKAQVEKLSQLYHFAEFGKLSSGVFHDIINLINPITLNLQRLKTPDAEDIAASQRHLDKVVTSTRQLEHFIDAVRKQMQNQNSEISFVPRVEIQEVIDILTYKANKAGVTLNFISETESEIFGSQIKFHQIITNLISNAIDAYEESNRVDKIVHITLTKKDTNIVITVCDNGVGISESIISKIYEPYFTTKQRSHGIGLGLSTTKDIVEKSFYGTITVQSIFGQETIFTVTIPLTHEAHHE